MLCKGSKNGSDEGMSAKRGLNLLRYEGKVDEDEAGGNREKSGRKEVINNVNKT